MARRTPDTTEEWLEYYRTLYQRNFDNYQSTGESKYDNAAHKYSVIVDGLEALVERRAVRKKNIAERSGCAEAVIEELYKDTYTRAEVAEMLRRAVLW